MCAQVARGCRDQQLRTGESVMWVEPVAPECFRYDERTAVVQPGELVGRRGGQHRATQPVVVPAIDARHGEQLAIGRREVVRLATVRRRLPFVVAIGRNEATARRQRTRETLADGLAADVEQ